MAIIISKCFIGNLLISSSPFLEKQKPLEALLNTANSTISLSVVLLHTPREAN